MDMEVKMNKKRLHTILLIATIVLIPLIAFISLSYKENLDIPSYYTQTYEEAEILKIKSEELKDDEVIHNMKIGKQVVILEIKTGPYKGEIRTVTNTVDKGHNVISYDGKTVIVGIIETEDDIDVWVYSHKRSSIIYLLIALFVGVMVYFGRSKGIHATVALIFTATVLIFIMIPLIYEGANLIITTIGCAIVASVVSFFLIGGFENKTIAAMLGTLCGIITAGTIAFVFGEMTHLTAVDLDYGLSAIYEVFGYKQVKLEGLLFASILIASMGAVMDVSMSIASAMFELHQINKKITFRKLYHTGITIGKDIMGTMANTIILVFMGGSIGLMLYIWGLNISFRQLINMKFISVEIIQGLAGSIGIVLTVPFTAFVACVLYLRSKD